MSEDTFVFPTSYAQRRLWFFDQLEPGSSLYNIPWAIRAKGALNTCALRRAIHTIVERHEILRTTFSAAAGDAVQLIADKGRIEMSLMDISHLPESDREDEAMRLAVEEGRRPFNLTQGPLFRPMLIKLGGDEHMLLLTMHHIISDGWSMGVLFRELAALYSAYISDLPSPLLDLPIQYGDFAQWQRDWMQAERLDQQLAYWREQLGSAADLLDLPTDRPRPAVQSYRGAMESFQMPKKLMDDVRLRAQEQGVTVYMYLLAGLSVLMQRLSGQKEISIGTPIANRVRGELEGLIGLFVNTLVMKVEVRGEESFGKVVERVKEAAIGGYENQDIPFEKLVEVMQPERSLSHNPLFQVMFILQDESMLRLELPGLTLDTLRLDIGKERFDFTMAAVETEQGLSGSVSYNTDLYDEETIGRMLGHYQRLLESVTADPTLRIGDIPILSQDERHQLLVEFNSTASDYPRHLTVQELFQQQARLTPESVALECEAERITYRELDRRANRLGHYLKEQGVGPDVLVGVMMERGVEMIVGLLGVLKAGGAYVPLDVSYPEERVAYMLEDSGAAVVVTKGEEGKKVRGRGVRIVNVEEEREEIGRRSEGEVEGGAEGENLAYVIYTSGSTGKPKGVQATHRAAINRFSWMWNTYPFEPHDVCCQKTALSFVDSVWEIFGPLLQGRPNLIIPDEVLKDTNRLLDSLRRNRVTRIVLVPSLLRVILESRPQLQSELPDLKYWMISGEALLPSLMDRFYEAMPEAILLNLYGSSEVAADATWCDTSELQTSAVAPIGRPIANSRAYVMDDRMNLVPVGVRGELHIGGEGLARGYFNRPDLTAEKFIPDPFSDKPGARIYKTGDLARWLPDGNAEFLDRKDYQVKVRGHRVELGEIEGALRSNTAVREAVLQVCELVPGDKQIVAYYVPAVDHSPSDEDLLKHLRQTLPEYMLPSLFVMMDELPMTPSGKIDRLALPAPDRSRVEKASDATPQSQIEQTVAGIWSEVLKVEQIGLHDSFFALGGHSLLAMLLISRVQSTFDVELPFRDFFTRPTIDGLSRLVEEAMLRKLAPSSFDQMLTALEAIDEEEAQRMLSK